MKNKITLIIVLILLISCNLEIKRLLEYDTATGKRIFIKETHPNGESMSDIEIKAQGFEHKKDIIVNDIDPVNHIITSDLDNDGFDEIFIVTKSVGSGSYAGVVGYASNDDKRLKPVSIPEISENDLKLSERFFGYQGNDTIYKKDNTLIRKFPMYKLDDTNVNPTGAYSIVRYRLVKTKHKFRLEYLD